MYVKGLPAKQIAEQTGISFAALRQRIRREHWDADVTKAVTAMSHAVTRSLEQSATHWVAEIDGFVRDALQAIKRRDKNSLAIKDLKTLIETAELADRMARRTYRLDNEPSKAVHSSLVQVNVQATGDVTWHATGHEEGGATAWLLEESE